MVEWFWVVVECKEWMVKDVVRRKFKSYVRNEESKEIGSRDYYLCDSVGKLILDCG